jgi:imidazolonepropionase-like amidohydrolase
MNDRREIITDGAVIIQGSRILAVGPAELADPLPRPKRSSTPAAASCSRA